MDFHKSSRERDGKGAREVAEIGLCCSQKRDLVGKNNKVRFIEKSRERLMKGQLSSLEGHRRCSVTISRERQKGVSERWGRDEELETGLKPGVMKVGTNRKGKMGWEGRQCFL